MTISGIEINYHGIFNYHFFYSMCEYKRNSRRCKDKEYEYMPTINKKQSIRNQKHNGVPPYALLLARVKTLNKTIPCIKMDSYTLLDIMCLESSLTSSVTRCHPILWG